MTDVSKRTDVKHFLAKKSDIYHKVEMGILFDAFYDTETTDLNKRFAEITQFGGVITDLAGNVLHTANYRAKISPYTVVSPYAWLVQRLHYDDLKKGDPRSIFMGKVMQFFEHANHLAAAPFSAQFLSLCREGEYESPENGHEKYFSYPVLDHKGAVDWDYIRIHESLRKFYFKNQETGQWVKRDIKAMTIGYNNINADDQWLWTAAHMAGVENVFMTHLAQKGKYRLDALRVVEAAIIADGAGKNSLRAMPKTNLRTGEKTLSFSQGNILKANTHLASEARGILSGITLPDGSHIDIGQLHGAYADALSLAALMRDVRAKHPAILRQMEMNSDWKSVIDRLTEVKGGFGNNPPLAYVDKTYPTIDGKMVSLIGTDQYRNSPKVAIVWNLSIDPRHFRYNGKAVDNISEFEWKQILLDSPNNPNSPLKIIRAHKSPRLLNEATGYAAGFNLGLDRNEIHERIKYVRKAALSAAVMSGFRLAYPRLHGTDRVVLPQPEEELFTFSTLELEDPDTGEDVQVHHRVQNKVEDMAQKSRAHIMKVKSLWLSAIQFDENVFLSDSPSCEDAKAFLEKIAQLNKKLKQESGIQIPSPDGSVFDKETALHYKIKILFFARNNFIQGHIKDIGHHFWFEDADGIRFSANDVSKWSVHTLDEAYKSGNLRVQHEPANTMPLVIDRIIEELGYAKILGKDIEAQLQAYKVLRQQGLPHNHGQGNRWYTVSQAHKDIAKIEANELIDKDIVAHDAIMPGVWDVFMTAQHDNVALLGEYKKYINDIPALAMTDEDMMRTGINPITGYPQANFDYGVDINNTTIIDVPDRYLTNPVCDPVSKRPLWILPVSDTLKDDIKEKELSVLFRAVSTGRLYHLPTAKVVPVPPRSGMHSDFYKVVSSQYDQSGQSMPPHSKSMAIVGNGPFPLFDMRSPNTEAQSLHVAQRMFEGLISPKLVGLFKKPHGLMLRDDALTIKNGQIRLLEKDDSGLTGWEIETDITHWQYVILDDIQKWTWVELHRYGYGSTDEAIEHFSKLFTEQQKNSQDINSKAIVMTFGKIEPQHPHKGMMYFKPSQHIQSRVFMQEQFLQEPV